ncbi:MAG: hypothetical protein A3K19_02090 [Lentisphaerae bacterium RIFOXYB12_FULL_65_16]|nr:MAG: hypothetical protein A3K18_25310 [Lentisphaerae bacterium RIFOXYA12_64_32]OGV92589.1 MAG: hypothetical protein A3K19_02090 [Lentisphaerae bacterium RIFOXYB12_FULL_65_16]
MNVLVLGGDGYLGSHLVDEAVALGHQVTVFDRFPYGTSRNLEHLRERVRLVSGEFVNADSLRRAAEGQDIAYHFICMTSPAASWNDPYIEVEGNLRGALQLLEVLSEAKVRKVVFPSSGGTVYGTHIQPVGEQILPKPSSPYGIAKLATEHFLEYYRQRTGLAYDVYRIGNAYGPRQPLVGPQGVVGMWMQCILDGRAVTVYGDQSVVRDYVYVKDIGRLMAYSLRDPEASDLFNLGTGIGTSVLELLELFKQTIHQPFEYQLLPRRTCDNVCVVLDSTKLLARLPGFRYATLAEKLPETWDYIKQRNRP